MNQPRKRLGDEPEPTRAGLVNLNDVEWLATVRKWSGLFPDLRKAVADIQWELLQTAFGSDEPLNASFCMAEAVRRVRRPRKRLHDR